MAGKGRCVFSNKPFIAVMIFFAGVYVIRTETSSLLWRSESQQSVLSSLMTTREVSEGRCMLRCLQTASCRSAAFDSASQVCYLQPTFTPHTEGEEGPSVKVYAKASECHISDAPAIANGEVNNWQVTSSSLEGAVSCDADYVWSSDDMSAVSCQLDTGLWDTGTCNQAVWSQYSVSNATTQYHLPRSPPIGWTMCVYATPTQDTVININLEEAPGSRPLHLSLRLNWLGSWRTVVLDQMINWAWGPSVPLADPNPPFPLTVNQEFSLTVRAATANSFDVFFGSAYFASYTTSLSTADVNYVSFQYDVSVRHLHLWCQG